MNKSMRPAVILILAIICSAFISPGDFLAEQKKFPRVRSAFNEKEKLITQKLKGNKIETDQLNILIVIYKAEKQLDIFAKSKSEPAYRKLTSYTICSSSGGPGPKRMKGDNQVPEGFYKIDRFNPTSNFYLSLGVSYPNQSDRKKCKSNNPGGDIFIHGSCVTIGCMPMTDDKIKEIYLYAIQARQNGQLNIPVYIFPFKMTDENFTSYKAKYKNNVELLGFWTNLKTGFDKFENDQRALNVSVDNAGNYTY